MLLWFGMLGILGMVHLIGNIEILKAFNPYYAIHLLQIHHEGFYVLGYVFLCTTGAEALYSDLGHCGIKNIRISWIFCKGDAGTELFRAGAYLISHQGSTLNRFERQRQQPRKPFLFGNAGMVFTVRNRDCYGSGSNCIPSLNQRFVYLDFRGDAFEFLAESTRKISNRTERTIVHSVD